MRNLMVTLVLVALACAGCIRAREHPLTDALVPDEMSFFFLRGKIDGAHYKETTVQPYPNPIPPTVYQDEEKWEDQGTMNFGLSFTWHLRKDDRAELRAIRELLERREQER